MNPYGDDLDVALRALIAAFDELPDGIKNRASV